MPTRVSHGTNLARKLYRAARGIAYAGVGSRLTMSLAKLCGVRKATVFMFHRFSDGGDSGMNATVLRGILASLRHQGVGFMRLRDLATYTAEGRELPGPTAVFTVDDGYRDFDHFAAPIFAGFDAQPTVFVVTEFVAGRQWCWWDRVTECFKRTPMREIVLSCGLAQYRYTMGSVAERVAQARGFIETLKWVPDADRVYTLARMTDWLDVELPERPPAEYEALSWDHVRRLERAGIDFAPHTMTHPVLSRVSNAQLEAEVRGSWDALRQEVVDPTPVFSYPNGSPDSYGLREIRTVQALGFAGAVAFRRRYIDPRACTENDRFSLSRFPVPQDPATASYLASGLAWDED